MRNLKRALSLALASIMVIGMMVTGVSATSYDDFSDKDKIVNEEAVATLNALGVIVGRDGAFDPTGIVTRGEMAKMICVALNGGVDPQLGTATTNTYTDTVGHWASAYIEYCTNLGIVSGKGNGTFVPNATVTGTEAAKMLLVAMGYDPRFENFVGAQWDISVNVVANGKKLYSGLALNPGEGLTRDNAAQMVYNAVNAKMVAYDYALVTGDNGSLTSIPRVENQDATMLNKRFGALRVEGVVLGNEFTNNAVAMNGKTTIAYSNGDEIAVALRAMGLTAPSFTGSTFKVTTGKDQFGQNIILYVKPANNSANADKATVIAEAILDTSNVVVTTTKKFGTGKNIYDFAKDNGLKLSDYDSGSNAWNPSFYTNYASTSVAAADVSPNPPVTDFAVVDSIANGKYGYVNPIGTEITMIDNDSDGIVDVILRNTTTFGQVTKYNTKDDGSVTVRGDVTALCPSSEELKYISAYEDIATDDYVNVTKVSDTYYITKADVISGELESYKQTSGNIDNVTVDGTTYTTSGNNYVAGTKDLNPLDTSYITSNSVKTSGDLYLDAFGYGVAVKMEAARSYAYIGSRGWDSNTATGLNNGTMTVYAVLQDGTAKSYVVSKLFNSTGAEITMTDPTDITANTVYKYALDGDGKIKLTEIATDPALTAGKKTTTASGAVDYKRGEATFKYDSTDTVTTTNNTVFFYAFEKKGDSTKIDSVGVYVGKDKAPSVSGSLRTEIIMGTGENANRAVAVMVKTPAVSTTNYMYVIGYQRTTGDGDVYQVYLDGKVQEITTADSSDTRYKGGYTFTVNGNGLYDIKKPTTVTTGTVEVKDGNSLVTNNLEFDIKDAEVILIDGEDSAPTSVGRKDTVTVVYESGSGNAKVAKAVYVVEEYDTDNTGATMLPSATNVRQSANDSAQVKFDIMKGALASDILDDFAFSYGSDVVQAPYLVTNANKPANLAAADGTNAISGAINATVGDIYWLVVVSESGDEYSTYKCELVDGTGFAAPTAATITLTDAAKDIAAFANANTWTGAGGTDDALTLTIDSDIGTYTATAATSGADMVTALIGAFNTASSTWTAAVAGDDIVLTADVAGTMGSPTTMTLTGVGDSDGSTATPYAGVNVTGTFTNGTNYTPGTGLN